MAFYYYQKKLREPLRVYGNLRLVESATLPRTTVSFLFIQNGAGLQLQTLATAVLKHSIR